MQPSTLELLEPIPLLITPEVRRVFGEWRKDFEHAPFTSKNVDIVRKGAAKLYRDLSEAPDAICLTRRAVLRVYSLALSNLLFWPEGDEIFKESKVVSTWMEPIVAADPVLRAIVEEHLFC